MQWYGSLVGEATVNAVSEKSGLVQSTLNRQVRAGALSAESVVAIARAYGADVLTALMSTGLITREDIERHGIRAALAAATDVDITAEIMRRLSTGQHPILDAPLS